MKAAPCGILLITTMTGIPLLPITAAAMGLRSFVALPVEQGGTVARFQLERNNKTDVDTAIINLAWGLSNRQTLLFGLPYRLNPAGDNQLGDLAVLYRHIVRQDDHDQGTLRTGLLGGAVFPGSSHRDAALQAGFVTTHYRGRHEWDIDALYQAGLDQRPDAARYDISHQYRLTPAQYPEWGIGSEWDLVTELNGRWQEGNETVHQATLGVQWIQQKWVLEGGVTRDLNGPQATRLLLSTRFHF